MALPYVLALYRLVVRFGAAVDTDQLTAHVRALGESLRKIDEELEGRLSKGLVQIQNARDTLRDHVATAQRTASRLVLEAEPSVEADAEPPARPTVAFSRS